MVRKLRHLLGQTDIRILVLLVCAVMLAGLALSLAQLEQNFSGDDFPTVSSWDDLVKHYLDFRERNYALVVPGWWQTGEFLKEYSYEELQEEPDWYWTFNEGVYVFDDNSTLAKQVGSGTEIVIYEDMMKEELAVLSAPEKEGGECREEIVYRAPKWPALKKNEDYDQYLHRELSQRRIVWQVTLKSKSAAEKEAVEAEAQQAEQKDSGEGGGMRMMMGMEEASNHLWLSIQGPAQGLTNIEIAVHIPSGFTNRIEIFTATNLLSFWWTLAATNILTEGTDTVYWAYQMTEAKPGPVFFVIGNADIDSDGDGIKDARERFLYHTDPNLTDTDGDGAADGQEIEAGTNPLNNPGDTDGDGLSDDLEAVLGTSSILADTDGDWVSDGYEYEQGADPLNSASVPGLRMEVEGGAFYAKSTNLQVRIQGLVADQLALAEVPTMENAVTNPFSELVYFGLSNETNGKHYVSALAVRGGTNTFFIGTASIILDTMPPFLSVTNPSSGLVTADRWVAIEGLATDEVSSVCVKLNGQWADGVSIGRFWKSRYMLNPGTNLVDITGSDAAGNCVTQTLSIVQDLSLDTNAPVMSLDLPSDFTVQAGLTNWNYGISTFGDEANLAFRGSIDDRTAIVSLRVESPLGTNGPYAVAVGLETQVWGVLPLFEGSNRLIATASDAAGNSSMCEWTVIRSTCFVFRIASPLPWAVINSDSTYVTCIASPEFSNAVVTVNGQSASIVPGSNLTFRTDAVVPLGNGVSKISACAILNGQSYYADPVMTTYNITRWRFEEHRDFNVKGRVDIGENYDCEIYRSSDVVTWDQDSKMEEHCHTTYWWTKAWDGTETEHTDDYCTTNWPTSCPNGSIAFGLQQFQYSDYEAVGFSSIVQDGELNIIDNSMIKDKELVYLQFPGLDYGRLPNESIDPAKIKFRGQPGFWYNSNVTFIAEIERNTEYSITALNFDWPAYSYTESGSPGYFSWMRECSGHWLTIRSVVMDLLKVDITFADPDDSGWTDLEEQKVILSDKDARIKIKITPQLADLQTIFSALGTTLKVKTSETAPSGQDFTLTTQNTTLTQGSGYSELRIALTRAQLISLGVLPSQESDSVNEKAWIDHGSSSSSDPSNLTDGEAFESGSSAQSRGRSTNYGDLSSTPPNSPVDETFFVAAGREVLIAEYGCGISHKRQIMNQADYFYYSGHGGHDTAVLQGGFSASDVTGYWDKDLHYVILAGCSVLDIKDYRAQSFGLGTWLQWYAAGGAWSPGAQWEPTGPKYFLGYNWSAPLDNQGSAGIISNFLTAVGGGASIVDAWKQANDLGVGRNACVIDATSSPHVYWYWDETSGTPVWTNVTKSGGSW